MLLAQLALAWITRSLTKLALEAHWTSNLSEFPLRVVFALNGSAQAGRQRTQNTTQFLKPNHTTLPCLRQSRRRQTSLASKAHCAFNSEQARRSELLSRAKWQRSGRSSAHASHNLVSKAQPHNSALPSSIETKADLACVESTLCFQL